MNVGLANHIKDNGIHRYIELLDNTTDFDCLREKLLKDYNRYAVYFEEIPLYYKEYPQRQPKNRRTAMEQ